MFVQYRERYINLDFIYEIVDSGDNYLILKYIDGNTERLNFNFCSYKRNFLEKISK